jgi:hypothetical protein
VKTPGIKRASPQKARHAFAAHATSIALSDEEDVFRCDDLKSSPPPLMTMTESSDHDTKLPSQIRGSHSTFIEKTQVAPQPLPSAPSAPSVFVDMSIPLKEEDASASDIARNPRASQFPSLAAPSPLRKSIRNHRESSLEPNLTTTPGTGLTGNHTSWLAKVREAKAMEVTNKRASVAPLGLVAPSGGLKRKSDEIPPSSPSDGDDSEEPKPKILKTGVGTTEAAIRLESRPAGAPSLQLSAADAHTEKPMDDVMTLQTDSEADMMAPLKKAIEALRARTGKSLAGNLTETNVQEPSPVDLEVVESKVVNDALPESPTLGPSLSVPVPIHETAAGAAITHISALPRSPQQVTEPTIVPPLREGSTRLSISDLVPKHDRSKSTSHTLSNETSISTTPPDSPPVAKKTAFFVPGGPVFNKPPPVFVPPPATKPAHSPSDRPKGYASELPGYSLGTPFSLGLQPTKLPKSPPGGPFSAGSTQSSSLSDSVFGSQGNVPAWAPHSQNTQLTSQESQPVVEKVHPADIDDDDSWPIDDKLASTNQTWTPFAGVAPVEDSMTWSTVPSESQSSRQDLIEDALDAATQNHQSRICVDEADEDMDVDDDMKRNMLDEGKPPINLVTVSK